jgi:DNA-binding MarR family transcriptional regulator
VSGDQSALGPGGALPAAIDAIDAGIVSAVADLRLPGYRARFSGIVRVIAHRGPCTINDLATATNVSHSAASQTVSEMRGQGFVALARGADERQRIVSLSDQGRRMLPAIEAEWAATTAALVALDGELSVPLATTARELAVALQRVPFRQRIADAARDLPAAVTGDYRDALITGDGAEPPASSAEEP